MFITKNLRFMYLSRNETRSLLNLYEASNNTISYQPIRSDSGTGELSWLSNETGKCWLD